MKKINIRELLRLRADRQVRPLHIELGSRSLEKRGEINNIHSVTYHPQLHGADELSFTVYKQNNGEHCRLWEELTDFKLVWVKEYDEWFQIKVDIDESETITRKLITAVSLCEAELSQIMLYDLEINTESDIVREDYVQPTVFYDPDAVSHSLLHRILEKAPHYSIAHVDDTLRHIQRSFSADQTSIYDFMNQTLAAEVGCLFLFDTNTRQIDVYDLQTTCLDCGYRSTESFRKCPECNSHIIHEAYGRDTSIYIDKTNLGNSITLSSNTDAVKNCFRVLGGDNLMNASIRMLKPDGSPYIYYFSEDAKSDMPALLQEKMNAYNMLYADIADVRPFSLDAALTAQYNEMTEYVHHYYPDQLLPKLKSVYTGFSNFVSCYYDVLDAALYLENGMMPSRKTAEKSAKSQLELLTAASLSPVAVADVSKLSVYSADNAVLSMAKTLIDTGMYKVELFDSTLVSQTWSGKFRLTGYADKEDTAQSATTIQIEINDDQTAFAEQKITKAMAKINDPDLMDLYHIKELKLFRSELHRYCAKRLSAYESAYQTAVDVLIEQGIGSEASDLYKEMYLPYYERLTALQNELLLRSQQIEIVYNVQSALETLISETQECLNFEKYLGNDLWKIFVSYRREQEYRNENYISDGLDNTALIQKAQELLSAAQQELIQSGEKQFMISAGLQNLLLLTNDNGDCIFEPLLDDFTLGNFIHCKIDGTLYQMRLTDVTVNYDDISSISCTFTDAARTGSSSVYDIREILSRSKSMAASYGAVKKQASQGEQASYTLEKLQKEGLDSALYNVVSTNAQTVIDEHGLLSRTYDDINDVYSDEQMRLNGTNLLFTTNAWRSCKNAVGKQKYTLNGNTYEEYGANADFMISGKIIAGDLYSANYQTDPDGSLTSGSHIDLTNGSFSLADGKIHYDHENKKLTLKDFNLNWSVTADDAETATASIGELLRNTGSTLSQTSQKAQQTSENLNALKTEINADLHQITAEFTTLNTKLDGSTQAVSTMIRESADGIEIGRTDSRLKAQFNNDKIKFTENNTLVASIDNGKFYGTDMELTPSGSFKMGRQIWLRRGNGHLSLKALY